MTEILNSADRLIGGTPLLELTGIAREESLRCRLLAKLEYLNLSGSVKDRVAKSMLDEAEARGLLHPSSVIIEPSSGNTGIALCAVAAARGYRCIIVMPDSVSEERRLLIRHYGAEVRLVHDEGDIGACISECVRIAEEMAASDPKVFLPQQFKNRNNTDAHRYHTALEIMDQVARPIHGFCSGIGTGGTLTGIGEVLKLQNPDIEIWAVEPENAAILAGGTVGTHLQMGIGDGIIPDILNRNIYDAIYVVPDEEALRTSKDLARLEGLMCGISSGTNVAAAIRLAKKLGPGKTVVTILPDTAERYFSTPLFDD